jgi:hypothetical protein
MENFVKNESCMVARDGDRHELARHQCLRALRGKLNVPRNDIPLPSGDRL